MASGCFQCVSNRLAADGGVDRRDHVILTGQRNRAILCAADVVARRRAESSGVIPDGARAPEFDSSQ